MNDNKEHKHIDRDKLLEKTKLNIDKFGLQVITVSTESYNPTFAYSVGLTETYNHPEIICFGLPNDLAHQIINDVVEIIKKSGAIKTDKEYDNIFRDSRATFLKVDKRNIDDYFGVALEYYKDMVFEALQLIWTDRNDKFPWEENFEEEFIYKQPLLDRNADFKFREPRNLATFTTKQWLELRKPILRVVHEHDGDWQFLTGDQMLEDMKIVSLEQLVSRDNTLNELFDLDYGEEAERESIGGRWTRSKFENEEESD
jgi:hypothetical protein